MTETKKLLNYDLDIVDITEFKTYLEENKKRFSTEAYKAYLKAVDIPPKFFKEQPLETQEELLDNREIFVKENKKYFNKVIVVVKYTTSTPISEDTRILGAARLDRAEVETKFNQLKTIEQIPNRFEHRSFVKDGYISLIISEDIKKDVDNQVLAIDFPINLNKKPVIHQAFYTLPNDTFAAPIEHIKYITDNEVDLGVSFNDIKEAIDEEIGFLTSTELDAPEPENILREPELVALALSELKYIPKSYIEKLSAYISDNTQGNLTTARLESLVLDFDETVKGYKQVTSLRDVSGFAVLRLLESDSFKEIKEELEDLETLELVKV